MHSFGGQTGRVVHLGGGRNHHIHLDISIQQLIDLGVRTRRINMRSKTYCKPYSHVESRARDDDTALKTSTTA